MKIPKEKLGQFGISIRVNRKEKLRKLSSASWTQKGFCEGICSEPSLISMEKGKPGRFLDNYEMMAEKLGKRIVYAPEIDKKIENYTKHLYKGMEYYDLQKIEKYCEKSLNLLEDFQDCLWYGDLYKLFEYTKMYYCAGIFLSKDKRELYTTMIGEFNCLWDEILKSLIFNSAFTDVNSDEFIQRFADFKFEKCNSAFNKVNCLMYYLAQDNTSKFKKLLDEVKKEWIMQENYIRLIDAYNMELVFLSCFDSEEVDVIANILFKTIQSTIIPNSKLAEIYYNLGVAYYAVEEYHKTIEMMDLSYKYDENHTRLTFIYIGLAQRLLNEEIIIPYFSDEELNRLPDYAYNVYHYFSKMNSLPAVELESMLMKDILPMLTIDDDIFINLLRQELVYLVDKTKHYKKLMIFDQKVSDLKSRYS